MTQLTMPTTPHTCGFKNRLGHFMAITQRTNNPALLKQKYKIQVHLHVRVESEYSEASINPFTPVNATNTYRFYTV